MIDRKSFDSVKTRWLPEANEHREKATKILIATKKDLRDEIVGLSETQRYIPLLISLFSLTFSLTFSVQIFVSDLA